MKLEKKEIQRMLQDAEQAKAHLKNSKEQADRSTEGLKLLKKM